MDFATLYAFRVGENIEVHNIFIITYKLAFRKKCLELSCKERLFLRRILIHKKENYNFELFIDFCLISLLCIQRTVDPKLRRLLLTTSDDDDDDDAAEGTGEVRREPSDHGEEI